MVKWSYILAGGIAGGAIGYGAAFAYFSWKDSREREAEQEFETWLQPDKEQEDVGEKTEYQPEPGGSIVRVSKTGAGKWASTNGKEIEEVLYFPKDEVLGGYETGAFGQKTFVVADVEDVLASFIEDRRIIPGLTDAYYVYEGQCYHVKADEEHEFAEMFDTLNQDIPEYPEE